METIANSKKMVLFVVLLLTSALLLTGCKKIALQPTDDQAGLSGEDAKGDDMDDDEDADEAGDEDMDGDENAEEDEDADAKTGDMDDDADLVADVTFNLVGSNYTYDVKTIEVNEGDTVTINFVSENGFHDWVVDEFNAKTKQVNPGEPTSVTFVANKKGTFEYYCSVGQHRANGMVGQLIVK